MRPRVLIVDAGEAAGNRLRTLDSRQSHHLVRVLRLGAGAAIECFDGAGARFAATVERDDPRACTVRLGERLASSTESALRLALVQGISGAERMDWTIEKAVELGVHEIRPIVCARSQVRLDATRARRRHEHWSRIVEAACMQCGRDVVPTLHEAVGFEQWIDACASSLGGPGSRAIVLVPSASVSLSALPIDPQARVHVAVGPESGFSDREIAQALDAGFVGVRLGPRILRTETAGLAAIAALQATAGDY